MIKHIKGLKLLSIFAISCTIILWLALWASSLVPSDASQKITSAVTEDVDQAFGVQDKINSTLTTQSISLSLVGKDSWFFLGDTAQLVVTQTPSGSSDIEVDYVIKPYLYSGDGVIDENGLLTLTSAGGITVTAYLKSDPEIYDQIKIYCRGEDPLDPDHPERTELGLYDATFDNLTVGERKYINFNYGKTTYDCIELAIEDEDIAMYKYGYLYPRKVGQTTMTVTINNGVESKSYLIELTVANDAIVTLPEIVFKEDISLEINDEFALESLLVLSDDAYNDFLITSSNSSVIRIVGTSQAMVVGAGEVTLTYTSLYSSELSNSITLNIEKATPKYIKIVGNDRIIPGEQQYYADVYPINYNKDVKWSVVEGRGSVNENGLVTADFYGNLTIRCQSTIDESIYVDKTIKVTLYSSPYMFVRKLMGHAGLSALLGFGLMGTALLLCRRKYNSLLSIPLAFGYAGISELLQKLAPGRSCLFTDVVIDFVGALTGMAVAIVVFLLSLLIWRIVSKKSFNKLIKIFKVNTFRNLFVKSSVLEERYFPQDPLDV